MHYGGLGIFIKYDLCAKGIAMGWHDPFLHFSME